MFVLYKISWVNKTIKVGTGLSVGEHEILSHTNQSAAPVNYLSLFTWSNADIDYDFDQVDGKLKETLIKSDFY